MNREEMYQEMLRRLEQHRKLCKSGIVKCVFCKNVEECVKITARKMAYKFGFNSKDTEEILLKKIEEERQKNEQT